MKTLVKISVYIGLTFVSTLLLSTIAYADTRGTVTGGSVNVRAYAEINDSNRLFQVNRGHDIEIVGVDGDFFRANINGYENVYIAREWVTISETFGVLSFNSLNVYDLPREYGGEQISTVMYYMSSVVVVSHYGEWFGIIYNGELAFVERTHVIVPVFVELEVARIRLPGSATLGEEIVELALGYLGTRYVFGGTTPAGFDCSGFMQYVLRQFDVSVNRVSRDQARNGVQVSRSDLQPADLVFFAASPGGSRITHVGMYIGDGNFIHASTWNTGVRLSNIHSDYHRVRFVTARRVI